MGERVVGSLLELLDNAARDDQARSKRGRTDPLALNAKQLRQRLAMEARFATKLYVDVGWLPQLDLVFSVVRFVPSNTGQSCLKSTVIDI